MNTLEKKIQKSLRDSKPIITTTQPFAKQMLRIIKSS